MKKQFDKFVARQLFRIIMFTRKLKRNKGRAILIIIVLVVAFGITKAVATTKAAATTPVKSQKAVLIEKPVILEFNTNERIRDLEREKLEEIFTPRVRVMLAQVLYAEAGCVESTAERSMVIWTVLNRYDSGIEWFGENLEEIIARPYQFAYSADGTYTKPDIYLVNDVIERYIDEKLGETNVGRTLPSKYWFFHTDYETTGWHNYFYCLSEGLDGEVEIYDRDHPIEDPYTAIY